MSSPDFPPESPRKTTVGHDTNDCYSASERGWMERGQQLRGKLLNPILVGLTTSRIRPDHLTILSVAFGIAFAPLWLWNFSVWAMVSLAVHVLLDGLDGPLARHQSVASPRGSFTDTFCDQIVVTTVTISLMLGPRPYLGVVAGTLFLVLYTVVVVMAMVRNALRIPYVWLIRPRFFLFLAIPIELAGIRWATEIIVWASNAILAIKATSGFYALRDRLAGPSSRRK